MANYGGGSVAAFPIGDDGRIAKATTFIQHEGSSANKARQSEPHAHSINVDAANRFAVAADLGLDKLFVYQLDPARAVLTPNEPPFAAVPPGSGPRHFAFHPDGKHAYVINELASTVDRLRLRRRAGSPDRGPDDLARCPKGFTGTSYTAEVQVHPSGKFVYGSNRGDDSIAVFTVDPGNGLLTLIEHRVDRREDAAELRHRPVGPLPARGQPGFGHRRRLPDRPDDRRADADRPEGRGPQAGLREVRAEGGVTPCARGSSAFPKCYIDRIAGDRSMSVFDWIAMARDLDADGLEMYEGFFESLDDAYIHKVGEAIRAAGFAMPMLCCSPDFTDPDPEARKRAVERQAKMVVVAHRLGGPGTVCRVLSGQRRPGVGRRQGIAWVVSCIEKVLPVAREHGVILGLENHYKDSFWTEPEFAQKADVFLELLADIPERALLRRPVRPVQRDRRRRRPDRPARGRGRPRREHARQRPLPRRGGDAGGSAAGRRHDRLLAQPQARRHRRGAERLRRDLPHPGRSTAIDGWISIEDGMNGMDEMARSLAFLRAKVAEHFPA